MLDELPEELIFEILEKMETKNLVKVARVSHMLYRLVHQDSLWKEFVEIPQDKTCAPSPRLCHTAVVWDKCMWVHGGHTTIIGTQQFQDIKNDLYKYSFETREWIKINCLLPFKTEHSCVVYANKMWLFGGYSGNSFTNSLYSYDIATNECELIECTGDVPPTRSAHIGVLYNDYMYIFGGWNGAVQHNDMYRFHFATKTWSQVNQLGDVPKARCSHTACVCKDNVMYVFGGYGGPNNAYLNDLCRFNFVTETWERFGSLENGPSPRSRMRMVEQKGVLYMFGGWNKQEHFCDMFRFDMDTSRWQQVPVLGKEKYKIGQHSMCIYNNFMYLFGGFNDAKDQRKITQDCYAFRLGKPINLLKSFEKVQCDG